MSDQCILYGASAVIFKHNCVLLIKRGKGAFQGYWSLPGGHIRKGEAAIDAARREVLEETGLISQLIAEVDQIDVITRSENGDIDSHYVITVFCGHWVSGNLTIASDAHDADWFNLEDLPDLQLTEGAEEIIQQAKIMLGK